MQYFKPDTIYVGYGLRLPKVKTLISSPQTSPRATYMKYR